jgi:hypothetical protein
MEKRDKEFLEMVQGMDEETARTYCENYAVGEAIESELVNSIWQEE